MAFHSFHQPTRFAMRNVYCMAFQPPADRIAFISSTVPGSTERAKVRSRSGGWLAPASRWVYPTGIRCTRLSGKIAGLAIAWARQAVAREGEAQIESRARSLRLRWQFHGAQIPEG